MSRIHCAALCLLTLSVMTHVRGDVEVSCVFMESCILPCSFKVDTEVIIHWTQVNTGTRVHSYFHAQDQLLYQDQRFQNRTSLFKEQISRGNASLQLTGVQVQDQGRYKCITSTTREWKESFINLKVDAPVDEVDIQQVENRMTCSSEGIYPEPELTWSTSPPSNMSLQSKITVQQTEQQLYSITSSLTVSAADLLYSCTVSTRRNKRRATLKQLRSQSHVTVIVLGLVTVVSLVLVAGFVLYCKCKEEPNTSTPVERASRFEIEPLNTETEDAQQPTAEVNEV